MDIANTVIAGSSLSGIIIGMIYLIYKYMDKHKIKISSGCCKVVLETDRTPPDTPPNNQSPLIK